MNDHREVRKILGGLDREKQEADELGVVPGTEVTIVGGSIGGSKSYYLLEGHGIAQFNTVMFSGSWQDHQDIMEHTYKNRRHKSREEVSRP